MVVVGGGMMIFEAFEIPVLRILDPHWKKMDPDPGHFFKI